MMGKEANFRYFSIFLLLGFFSPIFAQDLTFVEDIAPIIFKKCTPCHHPGQIGPMPFTTYEEVASYATMIGYVTKVGYMPPWFAHSEAQALKGTNTLTAEELQLLQQWIAEGFEEGDPKKSPPLPFFADTEQMKDPDLVVAMSEAFEQYGVYYDQYRVFVLPTNLEEDQMISAIEFVPGNNSIVRGATISVATDTAMNALDEWDPQYGYFSFGELGVVPDESRWHSWQPGKGVTVFAPGQGLFLPKNAKLLLHLHYGPTGVPAKDASHINLKFSSQKKVQQLYTAPLMHPYNMTNDSFFIAKDKTTRYHASFTVPFDLELHGLFPHSHLLGQQWEVFTVSSDRKNSQSLLKIETWDFNWKQHFEFESPIVLRKGTVVHALAAYNNSKDNLLNPSDPPRDMPWGKRMFEEMFLVYFSLCEHIPSDQEQKSFFRILPGASNATLSKGFTFSFQNYRKGTFTAQIKDFTGTVKQEAFKDKSFKKGEHTQAIDLQQLAPGNYYIELQSGDQEARRVFVLLEEDIFD